MNDPETELRQIIGLIFLSMGTVILLALIVVFLLALQPKAYIIPIDADSYHTY